MPSVTKLIKKCVCVLQIEDQKVDIKAQSKIGSLDNVKHRPGGGDKKIFDDKEYLKQVGPLENSKNESVTTSGSQVQYRLLQLCSTFPLYMCIGLHCDYNFIYTHTHIHVRIS